MKIIYIFATLLTLVTASLAFVLPTSFEEQVQKADAVARINVVEIATLNFKEQETWTFTGIAKCQVVTDYSGELENAKFIYIPCEYTFDESPSPLEVDKEYIICLDLLNHGRVAHQVSYDAAYEISKGMLDDPRSDKENAKMALADFESYVRTQLNKKENKAPK